MHHGLIRRRRGRAGRRSHPLHWLAVAASLELSLGLTCDAAAASERYEMRRAVSARATAGHRLRPAEAGETLTMSLMMRLPDRDALDALTAAQQSPTGPLYHRWLSPEEFAQRFAPSAERYDAVVEWLRRSHFTVRTWPNRLRIDFAGTVAQVGEAFQVRMNQYHDGDRIALANENPPLLPSEFADVVAFVRLNTFSLAQPVARINGPNGVVNVMAPRDMYSAYDVTPVLQRGIDGSGQTIAVVARADFNDNDIASFQERFAVSVRAPRKVFPGDNPGVGSVNGVCKSISNAQQRRLCIAGEQAEVSLDVEWANVMAPEADVLVDIAATDIDASLADIVTNHPEAKIISMSFGACERLDPTSLELFGPTYAQAAVQGQTVLVAAGDDGADGCRDGKGPSVNVLASDPNVMAIGGTALDPAFDAGGNATGYRRETAWQGAGGATGGGPSTLAPKPAYQAAPGVPADGFRSQPDVSLMASPAQAGYVVVLSGSLAVIGGTSAAAPNWAGIVALMNAAVHRDGSGALNHALYAFARKQYAENGPGVFHDVTIGNNSFNGVVGFAAGSGFDLATGLGTPDVDQLVAAFVASMCVGDCSGDAAVTVDELLTGAAIALGQLPVTACLAFDANADGQVTIDELLQGTNRALGSCPAF